LITINRTYIPRGIPFSFQISESRKQKLFLTDMQSLRRWAQLFLSSPASGFPPFIVELFMLALLRPYPEMSYSGGCKWKKMVMPLLVSGYQK
jgi:hypothetical protein